VLVTLKDLPKIKFPVFVLPSDDWYETDKVLFMDEMVLDEKNMPAKTLGVRRAQCGRSDLYPLKKAIFSLPELIQCKTKNFIDRFGKPFSYMKTYNSRLKSYRIRKIEKKEVASLLWLQGVPTPFTIERPPIGNPLYARMLHLNGSPWLIYDYGRSPEKDTYRRV
jgi:hypothetical protein